MPRIDLTPNTDPSTVIQVGDVVLTDTGREGEIGRLSIALEPHSDPAAEKHFADVERCEISLPYVVSLIGGNWAYGTQLRAIVRRFDEEGASPK
jgi:hypothetical protein